MRFNILFVLRNTIHRRLRSFVDILSTHGPRIACDYLPARVLSRGQRTVKRNVLRKSHFGERQENRRNSSIPSRWSDDRPLSRSFFFFSENYN
ncbi:hypothetical protein PUN28_008718 [Cardiocondyla obscurior]|uniref:Uncharacterized protein n=1 Tax=Cardiocondyla obscurior TaxID=286306 RepID=A0AAW2G519_9HYME